AHLRRLDPLPKRSISPRDIWALTLWIGHLGDGEHVAVDGDAELAEELAADGASGDAGCRLARAGPLDHCAQVVVTVFERASEIRMPRPRQCYRLRQRCDRVGTHAILPVGPVAVLDTQRDRGAKSATVAHAGENLHRVPLDLHAAATP